MRVDEAENGTMHGMSRARAHDGGTWSRSTTRTRVHKGEVRTGTRAMAHEPGSAGEMGHENPLM